MSPETENQQQEAFVRDLFNISNERELELRKLTAEFAKQYNDSKITNCKLLQLCLEVTDYLEEKQFIAYLIGEYVGISQFTDYTF